MSALEFKAELNHLRVAPRKVKLVVDAIRKNRRVPAALSVLQFIPNRSASPIKKLILSAAANARNVARVPIEALRIVRLMVNEGPKAKRGRPRERGRMSRFFRRTSHVKITLRSDERFTPVSEGEKAKPGTVKPKEEQKREYQTRIEDESATKTRGQRVERREPVTRKVIP